MREPLRRSKLEIYVDVLRVLARHGPLKITHIMYKANVNCTVLKQFLDSLVQQSLIEEQVFHKKKQQKIVYAITERGRATLNHFRELTKFLQTTEEPQRSHIFI